VVTHHRQRWGRVMRAPRSISYPARWRRRSIRRTTLYQVTSAPAGNLTWLYIAYRRQLGLVQVKPPCYNHTGSYRPVPAYRQATVHAPATSRKTNERVCLRSKPWLPYTSKHAGREDITS